MRGWVVVPVLLIGSVCVAAECKNVRPYDTRLGIQSSPVLVVTDVMPGSIAARAGLQAGDIILATNGRGIRDRVNFQDFLGQVREHALWQSADLTVLSAIEGAGAVTRHVTLRLSTPEDRFGFVSGVGFYVEKVRPGGVGEKLGIQAGDFISKVSGQPTGSMKGVGDMDLAIQDALDQGVLNVEVSRLTSAQGGMTTWKTRNLKWSAGPLDGPTPPPKPPELLKY